MSDERDKLIQAARQVIEAEATLSGGFAFLPRRRLPVPQTPAQADPAPAALEGTMPRPQRIAALEAIDADEVRGCIKCRLSESRTHTVFGEGDPQAKVAFIGEGPGADEDATGRPFVGRAGELLTKMIGAMGLSREQVYIANVVKCRPPGNRTPLPDEAAACASYLIRQLQILRPQVIVTLGNPATQSLLQTKTGITKLRGQWHKLPALGPGLEGIAVMPTFHPSYVLRSYTAEVRGMVWDDLQNVMDAVGLPRPPKGSKGVSRWAMADGANKNSPPAPQPPDGYKVIYQGSPLPPFYAAEMLRSHIGKTVWAMDSGGRTRNGELRSVPMVREGREDAPIAEPVQFADERPLFLREIVCIAVWDPSSLYTK